MTRPITIFSGQWTDLPFEKFCEKAKSFGYEGVEIACWGDHLDLKKAATDPKYVEERKNILKAHNLKVLAIATHSVALQDIKNAAAAAKNMGVKVVTGFIGSPIWQHLYSNLPTADKEKMVTDAYAQIVKDWSPIFDDFDKSGIKFALELQPAGIAFDYYTAERLLKEFKNRKTLGFNFDPSHLLWQGITPTFLIRDFPKQILNVHIKDVAVTLDGRAGILGSFFNFGDVKRGWNFRNAGRGDIDWEAIIRELNSINYKGPLSVEFEDADMNREVGAKEAYEFVKNINISAQDTAGDDAGKTE